LIIYDTYFIKLKSNYINYVFALIIKYLDNNNMFKMYKLLSFCLLLIILANCDFLASSLTSYTTLTPGVTYTYNYTYSSTTIPASSRPIVFLSNNYNINIADLRNCFFIYTPSTPAYSSTTCTITKNGTGNYISFNDVYTS